MKVGDVKIYRREFVSYRVEVQSKGRATIALCINEDSDVEIDIIYQDCPGQIAKLQIAKFRMWYLDEVQAAINAVIGAMEDK